MPWMPEVFSAPIAEAMRASVNDAVPYYEGIMAEEPDALERSFAYRQPVLNHPRAGRVEGTSGLRAFADDQAAWLRGRDAVVENVALTRTPLRTVEEVALRLLSDGVERIDLPVAIVTDRNPDRTVKSVRVYHSLWPLTGEHRVRPPLLPEDPNLHAEGSPGDYQRALAEGDLAGIVATFGHEGYAREPSGAGYLHRGPKGLLLAPVRQRRGRTARALRPRRRWGAVRHRIRLRLLGRHEHPAPSGRCGLRTRERRPAGRCEDLRRRGAAVRLGHVRGLAGTSQNPLSAKFPRRF